MKTIVTVAASTPELPRKSEGDVIELRDGRLLLVYMEFGGDGSDFARYWTCEYLPDWAMQDIIDLRVALLGTAWFYGR